MYHGTLESSALPPPSSPSSTPAPRLLSTVVIVLSLFLLHTFGAGVKIELGKHKASPFEEGSFPPHFLYAVQLLRSEEDESFGAAFISLRAGEGGREMYQREGEKVSTEVWRGEGCRAERGTERQ